MKSILTSFILAASCFFIQRSYAQTCTALGQTPGTAFPVCGTSTFHQNTVPECGGNNLHVPGCGGDGNAYQDKNPFWYKFTCYQAGTLSFTITPADLGDDYDWQLYDITGLNPNDVFTNQNIVVTGNWSGSPGATGASAAGVTFIQCASSPTGGRPRFAKSPNLIVDHEYLLLVSHFDGSTQSGYDLSFAGGTAIITDPKEPHLDKATAGCDGTTITVKLNKKMKCGSLTGSGSEFSIPTAPGITVTAATTTTCSSGFNMEEIVLTLSAALPAGNHQLVIKNGSDASTLADNCDRQIPLNEQVPFIYTIPTPIPIDSVGKPGCAPSSVKLYFNKKIKCSSIAADGSNFTITGPTPVTVTGASGICVNDLSDGIILQLSGPIYTAGTYTVTPKLSVGGGAVQDECGQIIQPRPASFITGDTVSALFTYNNVMGCRSDTLTFSHDGAHNVRSWLWFVDGTLKANTQTYTIILPASSTTDIQLVVHNEVCGDTAIQKIVLDNEVIADFVLPADICPEDLLTIENTSKGLVDQWQWSFGALGNSSLKSPAPISFIQDNRERSYNFQLIATNNTLGCSDTMRKKIRVLNNCFIAVPTAFTPNGDGLNDFLSPNNALKAENLQFNVYNRWGQLVFASRDWRLRWDGRIGGIQQGSGVYVWFLSYTHRDTKQKILQKGTVTLIR